MLIEFNGYRLENFCGLLALGDRITLSLLWLSAASGSLVLCVFLVQAAQSFYLQQDPYKQ